MPIRICLVLSFLAFNLFLTTFAPAQEIKTQVRILYTSRLFGYYSAVDTGPAGFTNCPDSDAQGSFSPPVAAFLKDLNSLSSNSQRVLVGTGDNFAPEIEARIFTNPPAGEQPKTYQPHEKELYSWNYIPPRVKGDPKLGWILNRQVGGSLYREMLAGKSFIPADNVACFLRLAHYDAVVPGKHDFHFGPERLRLLARTLASPPSDSKLYTPVQMLGANLVIKTTWASDHEPIPQAFVPGKLGKQFYKTVPPKLAAVKLGISNGKSVYPWLQFLTVTGKLPEGTHAYLWNASENDPFVPQVPPCPGAASCKELPVNDKGIWFNLPDDWHKGEHFSILNPGRNYSLCITDTPVLDDSKDVGISCTWFSVFKPFFLYPSTRPTQGTGIDMCKGQGSSLDDHCYADPEPFVWKESKSPKVAPASDEVVIFGVVDPAMQQHVGEWNALWMNVKGRHLVSNTPEDRRDLRTSVSFEDPLEALRQIAQYFDRKYCLDHSQPGKSQNVSDIDAGCRQGTGARFTGSRILLAEMPAAQAQNLAVYMNKQESLGKFDAVISQGDDDFATRDQFRLTSPFDVYASNESSKPRPSFAPAFLVVPPRAWPFAMKFQSPIRSLQVINFTSPDIEAFVVGDSRQQAPDWKDTIGTLNRRTRLYAPDESVKLTESEQKRLASLQPAHNAGCLKTISLKVKTDPENGNKVLDQDSVNNLVLCAMQQKTHADIAMIQRRDVYWPVLNNPQTATYDLQSLLDAVLWKGDFVVVLAIPGSTLQKILKESADFDRKDSDNLSLEREFGRGLLTLGIVKDGERNEYVVNAVPLDPGRLYTVATTDYIAAGDTGYQELASIVGSEKPEPQYENRPLQLVSAAVCQAAEVAAKCDDQIIPDDYFDQLAGSVPADPRAGNTAPHQIRQWSVFRSREKDPLEKQSSAEKDVQNRPVWSLSFDKLSVGYGALYHSFSETNLNNFFGGVQANEVTAPRFINWNANEKLALSRSYRRFDLFSSQDLNYVAKFTATTSGPSKVNQSADILDFDNGAYWHLKGRQVPHYDFSTVFHIETQAFAPILPLNLTPAVAGGPKTRNFELGRTWTILARTGPRYHNRHSYVEGGFEAGRDLNAIKDFQFVDALGAPIGPPCFPTANNPLQTCVSKIPAVTTDSRMRVDRQNRARTGVFWHSFLSIPFLPNVTESLENQGDFFFNNAGDNSTDTRLRHLLTDKVSFQVFPNLSFSPTYQVLFYENKIDHRLLWQQQAMITADFSFSLTNLLVHKTQLEYQRPPSK